MSHLRVVGFRLGVEPVHPPDLAEHGAKCEGEADRKHPGARLTDVLILPVLDEAAVDAQQVDGYKAGDTAHQHYRVAHGV